MIGGDLNVPTAYWNGYAERISGTQTFLNRLVWVNGYDQVVNPTRGDALLDVYLIWLENSLISWNIVQGVIDHCKVLLEVGWGETCQEPQVEKLVPVFHKADV